MSKKTTKKSQKKSTKTSSPKTDDLFSMDFEFEGKILGSLKADKSGALTFKGDAKKTAKLFFEDVVAQNNGTINSLRAIVSPMEAIFNTHQKTNCVCEYCGTFALRQMQLQRRSK